MDNFERFRDDPEWVTYEITRHVMAALRDTARHAATWMFEWPLFVAIWLFGVISCAFLFANPPYFTIAGAVAASIGLALALARRNWLLAAKAARAIEEFERRAADLMPFEERS